MEPDTVDRNTTFVAGVSLATVTERPLEVQGFPDGAMTKILSRGSDGAASQVVSAPAGWSAPAGAMSTTVELFILSGELTVADHVMGHYGYLQIPPDVPISGISSGAEGSTFLLYSTGNLAYSPVAATPSSDVLQPISLHDISWQASTTAGVAPVLLHKRIAEHPETGARTWVIGLMHWGREIDQWETHPCAEEAFFLEGGMVNLEVFPSGTVPFSYEAGGYFYRPPGIAHSGPGSGTTTYALALCRSSSHLLVDWYDDAPAFPPGLEAIDFGATKPG